MSHNSHASSHLRACSRKSLVLYCEQEMYSRMVHEKRSVLLAKFITEHHPMDDRCEAVKLAFKLMEEGGPLLIEDGGDV